MRRIGILAGSGLVLSSVLFLWWMARSNGEESGAEILVIEDAPASRTASTPKASPPLSEWRNEPPSREGISWSRSDPPKDTRIDRPPLAIQVLDASGAPCPGIQVQVDQRALIDSNLLWEGRLSFTARVPHAPKGRFRLEIVQWNGSLPPDVHESAFFAPRAEVRLLPRSLPEPEELGDLVLRTTR